jgi:hypothetical protein
MWSVSGGLGDALPTIRHVADGPPRAPEPWDAIDLELAAEVRRLADRNLLSGSQIEELWSNFGPWRRAPPVDSWQ